ncbi:hypothetical protein ACFWBC_05395 [Streptomyces sp. NPDC059985]|uniref:hypothetical protein n=1 Tax=Streptomyces sp. NPDC059985 TaxID=3347025 RepID=UPI00369EE1A4
MAAQQAPKSASEHSIVVGRVMQVLGQIAEGFDTIRRVSSGTSRRNATSGSGPRSASTRLLWNNDRDACPLE